MLPDRSPRQVLRLLRIVDAAIERSDCQYAKRLARHVLTLDPGNTRAIASLESIEQRIADCDVAAVPTARPWTKAEDEELRALAGTMRATELARRLNRSVNAVYKRGETLGISLRYHGPPRRAYRRYDEI